jgi:hypothetical protein
LVVKSLLRVLWPGNNPIFANFSVNNINLKQVTFGLGVDLNWFTVFRHRFSAVAGLLTVINVNVICLIFLSLVLRVAKANSWVKA